MVEDSRFLLFALFIFCYMPKTILVNIIIGLISGLYVMRSRVVPNLTKDISKILRRS